jgi:hypothetical protein
MAVKNIECQLAQGQIGRYLAGTDMSTEAVSQLELHISECEDCSTFVDEKRKALKEMAGHQTAVAYIADFEPAEVPIPTPEPAKTSPAQALIQILKERSVPAEPTLVVETHREDAPPKGIKWKAFAYSGALCVVLLVMSHFTANPTALFGDRAEAATTPKNSETTDTTDQPPVSPKTPSDPFIPTETTTSATTAATTTAKPSDPTTELPNASGKAEAGGQGPDARGHAALPTDKTSNSNLQSAIQNPQSKFVRTPPAPNIRVTSHPVRTRESRTTTRKPATRRGNSIRVYDENGIPISGA